jgi:hypothetical protein
MSAKHKSWAWLKNRDNGARAVSLAIFAVVVMVLAVFAGAIGGARAYNADPAGAPIEPNPEIEGNVTFSPHLSGWTPLEYTAASGVGNLTASLDPRVPNPISVNPEGIVAPGYLQSEKVPSATTTAYWNSTTYFSKTAGQGGSKPTGPTVATINGAQVIQATQNTTDHVGVNDNMLYTPTIPTSLYPSQNPVFDYISIIYGFTGPSCATGAGNCWLGLIFQNASGDSEAVNFQAKTGAPAGVAQAAAERTAPGGLGYVSVSLSQISQTATAGFNVTGPGASASVQVILQCLLPLTATAGNYTATIYGFAFSTSPYTFGSTLWNNATMARQVAYGNLNLTAFAPTFTYTSVAGGDYAASVIEAATNLPDPADISTQLAEVNVANATSGGQGYIEQVTYQFTYSLPIAPGVSYTGFKLSDKPGVAGPQYVSVTYGGTSYTTTYQAYLSGKWYTVASGLTVTTPTAWLGIVYYTQPQWDSISVAPGLFSGSVFEYWWFVFLGAILMFGGATSLWVTSNREGLKTRRGAQPVIPSFRLNRRGTASARHVAAVVIGATFAGAGGIALWAFYDGADLNGAAAAFIGGLVILLMLAVVVFIVYEVARRARGHV